MGVLSLQSRYGSIYLVVQIGLAWRSGPLSGPDPRGGVRTLEVVLFKHLPARDRQSNEVWGYLIYQAGFEKLSFRFLLFCRGQTSPNGDVERRALFCVADSLKYKKISCESG
jgi:hypothetical protein